MDAQDTVVLHSPGSFSAFTYPRQLQAAHTYDLGEGSQAAHLQWNDLSEQELDVKLGNAIKKRAVRRSQLPPQMKMLEAIELRDIWGRIVEFSRDQHGSRFLQQKLETADTAEREMVFAEIIGCVAVLVIDAFANYVVQKFFEFGSTCQRRTILIHLQGQLLSLTLDTYGCRVMQKAFQCCQPEEQAEMVRELGPENLFQCAMNENGNHVIQKSITSTDTKILTYIIQSFSGKVFTLATHTYGCRVIQRVLEHCNTEQMAVVIQELHQSTSKLVKDMYGNYVIQNVLENGGAADRTKIIGSLKGRFCEMAAHKIASNVIEKCLIYASRQEKFSIIEEICAEESVLLTLMKDQYGNYVVQKCFDCAEPSQQKQLIYKIRPQLSALRKFTYARHIATKIEKLSCSG